VIRTAIIVVTTWALLSAGGAVVLRHVEAKGRDLLLPALPGLGAATLVAAFHWTGIFLPTATGVFLVAFALLAVGRLGWRREQGVQWAPLIVATLFGIVPLAVGLGPQMRVGGPRVVQPTYNNDAYAYVSLADWLQDHRAVTKPDISADPPAYRYTRSHLDYGLRIGEEFLHAAVATINRTEPDRTWYTVAALWLFLLPGTMASAVALLGGRALAGAVGGLATSLAALNTGQLYNQNSASLLGIALVPIVLALVVAGVTGLGPWHPPRWLIALGLAGLLGSYSEYAPFIGLGLLLLLLCKAATQFHQLGSIARNLVVISVLGLLMAPLAWYHTVRSFTAELGVIGDYRESAFLDVSGATLLNRLAGVTQLTGERELTVLGPLLCGFVAFGIVVAVARSCAGRRLLPFLVSSLIIVVFMSYVRRFPYGQQRAVEISFVLFMLVSTIGIDCWLRYLRERSSSVAPFRIGNAITLFFLIIFLVVNVNTARALSGGSLVMARNVDEQFHEAVHWLREVAEAGGENVSVLDSQFFQQLWIVYLLRDLPAVSYPFLNGAYMPGPPRAELPDGRPPRYLLVGTRDYVDTIGDVIVAENDRYRFLDLSRGSALVAMPLEGFHYDQPVLPDRRYTFWMAEEGHFLVIRSPGFPKGIAIRGMTRDDLSPLRLTATGPDGVEFGAGVVTSGPSCFSLVLPDALRAEIVIRSGKPVRSAPREGPPPKLFLVSGVAAGGGHSVCP
jgi:hypothetical protein